MALAQLERLDEFVDRREQLGDRLSRRLAEVEGITLQRIRPGSRHSYFLYLFRIDPERFGCTAAYFADALRHEGVNARANLITGGRPVYLYDIFQRRSVFPGSQYPLRSLDTGADRSYPRGLCPVAEDAFSRWIVVELLENYTQQNVDEMANAVAKVAYHLAQRAGQPAALSSALER